MKKFDLPVLLIAFNRPLKFKRLIMGLKLVKPKKIYVFVDGAKTDKDKILCKKTKNLVKEINWNCLIIKKYEKANNGVGVGPYKAISWFFKNEEMGLILEDDCVPKKDFFSFCKNMLLKYKYNNDVGIICGTNFVLNNNISTSYYFSKFPTIWGWATWRKNWKGYNLNLRYWKKFRTSKQWINICGNFDVYKSFTSLIDYYFFNKKKLWDVQYFIFLWKKNKINILPKYSLVKNIGIDQSASHTFHKSKKHNYSTKKIDIKLIHPKFAVSEKKIDDKIFYTLFYNKKGLIFEFIKNIKFNITQQFKRFKIKCLNIR